MSTDSGTGAAFIDSGEEYVEGIQSIVGNRPAHDQDRTERSALRGSCTPVTSIVRDNSFSFETLVRRLSPTLKRITCKLNCNFSFVDDQDLFQEALIHLWTHFAAGSLQDKTDSYVLQGCYFHLKNYLRKIQEPATVVSLSRETDEDDERAEDILDVRSLFSYDEVESSLEIGAMEERGITQREKAVLLFCLEGMTTREIGTKLGISHVSVVKIRNRIREKYESLSC